MKALRVCLAVLACSVVAACGGAGDPDPSPTAEETATTTAALTPQLFCPPGTHSVCPTPTTCKCVTDTYVTLHGSVTGLVGTGLTLINAGVSVSVSANGPVSITVKTNEAYAVDVNTPPNGPLQACSVTNGNGYGSTSMPPFTVTCGTPYTVGGTVTGLMPGAGAPYLTMSLESPNLGGQPLAVTQDGSFTFPMPVANGEPYSVLLQGNPGGENCSVANGSGTIAGSNVTNVAVTCSQCGGIMEPECASGNPCQYGYTPNAQGTCVPCGGAQEPVCATGNACNAGYTPSGGNCVACGGAQQPTCASGNPCSPGFTPNSQGSCVACGGDEEPACASGGACNTGYTVNPARSVCVPCGLPGLLGCNDGTTCTTGVLAGKRCLAPNATKAPELVVMCVASDFPGVVEDPQSGGYYLMNVSPLTTLIPQFFTPSGSGTDNLFDWFTEITYGRLDRSGTVVIPWTSVNYTQQQLGALGRSGRTQACVTAAKAANPSLDTSQFVDFVAAFNVRMDGGNQGDDVSTDPYGIFTNFMAQEVTHSLGQPLHTERLGCVDTNGNLLPYCDKWDEMSAANNYSSPNYTWWAPSNFGGYGSSSANGLVAGNLIVVGSHLNVGLLAPSEIYTVPTGATETVTLTAINRDERSGTRVIEIPGGGVYYTVELRRNTGWDNKDPETAVLVHSVQSDGQITLIPKSVSTGDGSYTSGDVLTVGNATVTIGTISSTTSTVPITITD